MSLFTQNKRDYREVDALITTESITLEEAYKLIEEIKRQPQTCLVVHAAVDHHHAHLRGAQPD